MALPPEFTERIDVQRATSDTYIEFIDTLRNLLEDGRIHNTVRQLCPQPKGRTPATRFFDVVFSTSARSLTVRFRRDNVYVVGFQQVQGTTQQWWEYGTSKPGQPEPPHLIGGSKLLGFSMTYSEPKLLKFVIGQQELVGVVNELGVTTVASVRERGMTMIALMISEAIRLNRVYGHVALMFADGGVGGVVPQWMVDLVHGWSSLSRAIIVANANGTNFNLPQPNNMNVVTYANATSAIGMALRVCVNRNALVAVGGVCCADMLSDDDICPAGRPLVEVFRVAISNIQGGQSGNFYGAITARDGLTSQNLYNVQRAGSQSLRSNEILILTGPSRPMLALGYFTIDISLARDAEASGSAEIAWDAFNNVTNVYDTRISDAVDFRTFGVSINYAVYRNAVQATMEFIIMGGGSDTIELYGTIAARSGALVDESLLFERGSDNRERVGTSRRIQPWRSVVAVPLEGTLIVRANLWRHNTNSSDVQLALGTTTFQARLSGTVEQNITGSSGIQVRVTWS